VFVVFSSRADPNPSSKQSKGPPQHVHFFALNPTDENLTPSSFDI
jgi:hypothetical protein